MLDSSETSCPWHRTIVMSGVWSISRVRQGGAGLSGIRLSRFEHREIAGKGFERVSHTAASWKAKNREARRAGWRVWTVWKESNGRNAAGERSRWRSGFLHSAAHDETVSCCGRNDIFPVGVNFSWREMVGAKVDDK